MIRLNLRIFEDLSFKEIADIMNCPYDTAKANYRHALLKLKNRMEENQLLKSWTEQEVIPTIKWGAIGAEVE